MTTRRRAGKSAEKHVVVITREWDNPEIKISVTPVRIAIAMDLPAFLRALAVEMRADKGTAERMAQAADVVCEKMKRETTRVMG